MKKMYLFLCLLIITGIALASCTPASTPPPTEQPVQAETQAPAPAETQAPAEPAQAEPVKLVIWWWGEQEAPGAQQWLDETIAEYQKLHPNVTIEAVLQSTDTLIPSFQAAAAAQQGPDIQYFWGGVWTLEFAWGGALVPLDDLIPAAERAHYINNFERAYDGKQWGMGWYLSGNPMVYNPKLFEQAGIEKLPETWDELIAACDKLNAAGVTPISGGLKDGWFGGWLFSILARQNLNSEKDFMKAAIGEAKFTDPAYAEWWERLNQLKDAKCWNEDINSVDYQQGQDLFVQGKSAMIFGNDTFLKGWAEIIGWENMGVMRVPKYGSGKLADTYVVTAQGWGITSWSQHQKEAADFLMFTHTPDRLNAWFKYTGVLPADDRFDPNQIEQPILKQIFEWVVQSAGPNLENFIPSILDEQANFTGTQLLFSGDKTPAELAQLAEDVIQKWREQNPDQLQNFQNWYAK